MIKNVVDALTKVKENLTFLRDHTDDSVAKEALDNAIQNVDNQINEERDD